MKTIIIILATLICVSVYGQYIPCEIERYFAQKNFNNLRCGSYGLDIDIQILRKAFVDMKFYSQQVINTTITPNKWTKYYTDGNLRKYQIKTKTVFDTLVFYSSIKNDTTLNDFDWYKYKTTKELDTIRLEKDVTPLIRSEHPEWNIMQLYNYKNVDLVRYKRIGPGGCGLFLNMDYIDKKSYVYNNLEDFAVLGARWGGAWANLCDTTGKELNGLCKIEYDEHCYSIGFYRDGEPYLPKSFYPQIGYVEYYIDGKYAYHAIYEDVNNSYIERKIYSDEKVTYAIFTMFPYYLKMGTMIILKEQ